MKSFIALVALGVIAASGRSADKPLAWPQFRGPAGSGVADAQKPPVEFGPDKNVKWKVPVPSGLSSPIVAGDKLVITAFDDGKLFTIAYNRADGKEAWRSRSPRERDRAVLQGGGQPRRVHAGDGWRADRIVLRLVRPFLLRPGREGTLETRDAARYPFPATSAAASRRSCGGRRRFGPRRDARLEDHRARRGQRIVEMGEEAAIPRVVWHTGRVGHAGWQASGGRGARSIDRVRPQDRRREVVGRSACRPDAARRRSRRTAPLTLPVGRRAARRTRSFKLPSFENLLKMADATNDGSLSREKAEKTFVKDMFSSFDANKDGKISKEEWDAVAKFMAEGKNSAFAVKAGGVGDVTTSHVLWKKTKGLPYVASAIVYRGQVVMVKDGGLVTAYDAATGKDIYVQERIAAPGRYYASPVAANGNIYLTALDDGTVTVLKAGSERPTLVVKNPKLGERVAATPAIADDTLYFRTDKHLIAFAEK